MSEKTMQSLIDSLKKRFPEKYIEIIIDGGGYCRITVEDFGKVDFAGSGDDIATLDDALDDLEKALKHSAESIKPTNGKTEG